MPNERIIVSEEHGIQIVREYFPDVDDQEASYILWNFTGFPVFWHKSEETPTAESYFRKQLEEVKAKGLEQAHKDQDKEFEII